MTRPEKIEHALQELVLYLDALEGDLRDGTPVDRESLALALKLGLEALAGEGEQLAAEMTPSDTGGC